MGLCVFGASCICVFGVYVCVCMFGACVYRSLGYVCGVEYVFVFVSVWRTCIWSGCACAFLFGAGMLVGGDWWLHCKVSRCSPGILSRDSSNVNIWRYFSLRSVRFASSALSSFASSCLSSAPRMIVEVPVDRRDEARARGVQTLTASPFSVWCLTWIFTVPWVFTFGKRVWSDISRYKNPPNSWGQDGSWPSHVVLGEVPWWFITIKISKIGIILKIMKTHCNNIISL